MASDGLFDDSPVVVERAGVFVVVSERSPFQKRRVGRSTPMTDDLKAPEFQVTIPRAPDDPETADGEWPVSVRFSSVEEFSDLLKAVRMGGPVASLPPPLLINAPEAAHLLGVSIEALKKRTQRYQMPAGSVVYTGRRVQYVRDRLVAPRKR